MKSFGIFSGKVKIASLKMLGAVALGLMPGGVCHFAWQRLAGMQNETVLGIASTFAGVSGGLLGFIIAALAILASLLDRKLLVNLRKTGHFQALLTEMLYAAVAFLIVMAMALTGIFLTKQGAEFAIAGAAGVLSLAMLLLITSGRKFWLVISVLGNCK